MDQRQDINIGGVTAYAYARSKGYTGTEAEFAQLMANIGNTQQEIEATIDEFVNTTVPGAVQTVETAQTSAQEAIGISKTDALDAINTSKGSAVAAVNSAGDTQKAAVDAEGQRVIDLIPADYTELTDEVDDLKNAVIEITYSGDIVAHETGKYINNNGAIANYDIFSYSELYPVKTGDKITATLACPSGFWSIWYATEGYATKERAVQGGGWNAVEQTLVSDRDGYVCFSYVTAQPHTVKIETSIIQEIEREIDSLQDAVEPLTPTEYDTTIPTHESGKYLTLGGINEWAPYSYSEPIPVTKGDFIEITAYIGPRIYAYYCADLDYSFRQNAFVGDAYEVKSYSFVAEKTCYLAVNFQTAYTHTIKINGNPLKRDAFTNPLLGKTVVWCGDSIMKGNTWNDSNSGWAGRCADILSFHFKNYAVGGSTICNNVPNGATPTIYTQIETAPVFQFGTPCFRE